MTKLGVITEEVTAKQLLLNVAQKGGAKAVGILTGAQKLVNAAHGTSALEL